MAQRVQCQINRVADLILLESENVLTTLRGFPFEAFRQFPKSRQQCAGFKASSRTLHTSYCPDRGGNRFGLIMGAGRQDQPKLFTPLREVARAPKLPINRVPGLILVENETVLASLLGFRSKLSANSRSRRLYAGFVERVLDRANSIGDGIEQVAHHGVLLSAALWSCTALSWRHLQNYGS